MSTWLVRDKLPRSTVLTGADGTVATLVEGALLLTTSPLLALLEATTAQAHPAAATGSHRNTALVVALLPVRQRHVPLPTGGVTFAVPCLLDDEVDGTAAILAALPVDLEAVQVQNQVEVFYTGAPAGTEDGG